MPATRLTTALSPATSSPSESDTDLSRPEAGALDNPFYYLENALTVLTWVRDHHGDLLTDGEQDRLRQFLILPRASQGLLVRLVMRTNIYFRLGSLNYPELGLSIAEALAPLVEGRWVDADPPLSITTVAAMLRKPELASAFTDELAAAGLGSGASKAAIQAMLLDRHGGQVRELRHWWPACPDSLVMLNDMALFDRIRLMFFGNLHQDWSEFVVTVLGYQKYEPVAFSASSRAFRTRHEVDHYLALDACRERLHNGEALACLWQDLPEALADNAWLSHRRDRLLFEFGQCAERAGDCDLALAAYRTAWTPDARVRYFRVQEKRQPAGELWPLLQRARESARTGSERRSLARICQRVAKKARVSVAPEAPAIPLPVQALTLDANPVLSVEQQVAACLDGNQCQCFYVENILFNGLFGLLFWPAIFAPLPGAFFHPFQAAPADLYREDFAARRQALIDQALASLASGDYRQRIWQYWHSRQGISNPFVNWSILTQSLLELALDCIPAAHLQSVFSRLLGDLRGHRSGFPDLVRFWPRRRSYELIEVKAPGDRLQDHQRLWLEFFVEQGIAASVCQVNWREPV